jgi:hypothetical protein
MNKQRISRDRSRTYSLVRQPVKALNLDVNLLTRERVETICSPIEKLDIAAVGCRVVVLQRIISGRNEGDPLQRQKKTKTRKSQKRAEGGQNTE